MERLWGLSRTPATGDIIALQEPEKHPTFSYPKFLISQDATVDSLKFRHSLSASLVATLGDLSVIRPL